MGPTMSPSSLNEPAAPISSHLENVPPELEDVLQRALAKDRDDRYSTAEDFAFDLGRVQEQLKRQMVSDYVARAKTSIEKADLAKAKEILQVVLKVDTQHAVAKELMQEVQQRLPFFKAGTCIKLAKYEIPRPCTPERKVLIDALLDEGFRILGQWR